MRLGVISIQVAVLYLFLFLGTELKTLLPLPIPASMYGLGLLFLALCAKIIKLEWVEKGANLLLAELLLFFVPSAVGIVNYNEIISFQGAEIVGIICISTIMVMGFTALIADKISGRKRSEQH
jgi:holin-like protein